VLFQGLLIERLQERASLHSSCKSSGTGDSLPDPQQYSILSPRVTLLPLWQSKSARGAEVVGKGSAVDQW